MKHYKDKLIPEHIDRVVEKVICDLCQCKIDNPPRYEVNNVQISYQVGSCFPEGSNGFIYSVDMCSGCFTSKLAPWIESQGAKIIKEDFGW